jgi:transposase
VYANRRRIRGRRGSGLLRRRGEYLERTFTHLYDTGGMRRTHLRGHGNILKRVLIHASGFNLGLLMRSMIGVGAPRGLQGVGAMLLAVLYAPTHTMRRPLIALIAVEPFSAIGHARPSNPMRDLRAQPCTGC